MQPNYTKYSLFQLPFNDALAWMQDTGILQKLLDTGYYSAYGKFSRTRYMATEQAKEQPLLSQNMYLVYFGLGIGAFLSLSAFILETRVEKRRRAVMVEVVCDPPLHVTKKVANKTYKVEVKE